MRLLRIVLFTAVISFVGAFASTGSEIGCIADGHPSLIEGSQSFCELGIFERVHADLKQDGKIFYAYLALNDKGFALYQNPEWRNALWEKFSAIAISIFQQAGTIPEIQFRHNGEILSACRANLEKNVLVCAPYEDFNDLSVRGGS